MSANSRIAAAIEVPQLAYSCVNANAAHLCPLQDSSATLLSRLLHEARIQRLDSNGYVVLHGGRSSVATISLDRLRPEKIPPDALPSQSLTPLNFHHWTERSS